MALRDMSALNAPPAMGGNSAPPRLEKDENNLKTVKAENAKTAQIVTGSATPEAKSVLNMAAAMVIGALIILWILGGIVFKTAKL